MQLAAIGALHSVADSTRSRRPLERLLLPLLTAIAASAIGYDGSLQLAKPAPNELNTRAKLRRVCLGYQHTQQELESGCIWSLLAAA